MRTVTRNHDRYQAGIAIGPILFVIAILAVLVSAISSGSGGFGSNTSPERARILAAQIINQAQQVKNAVDRVRANGCADNEISFQNGVVSGYTNTNATLAEKPWCHVFQPQGGGLTWQEPPTDFFDQAAYDARTTTPPSARDYWYARTCVSDLGTGGGGGSAGTNPCYYTDGSGADIVIMLNWMTKAVCLEINKLVNFTNIATDTPPTQGAFSLGGQFTGTFGSGGGIPLGGGNGNTNKTIGCMNGAASRGGYFMFSVLVVR